MEAFPETVEPVRLIVPPVDTYTAPPGDERRVFVVEQGGTIRVVRGGRKLDEPFLDIRDKVLAGGEQGLLSVAFAPDYATSGLLYAYYNNRDGNIRVTEFHRGDNPDTIPIAPRRRILAITKAAPFAFARPSALCVPSEPTFNVWIGNSR